MSKPVKNLVAGVYRDRFAELDGAVVVDIRGVKSNDNNHLRNELASKGVKVTVVKNSLARKALAETALESLEGMLEGPSALVYGGDTVVDIARQLIDLAKQVSQLEFKGALMEGQLFGPDEIEALSKYPTREEAQAQAIQVILSPGKNLAGAIASPGSKLASIIKTIEEKLEKGETIAKVA